MPLPRVYVGFRAPAFGDPRLDALDVAGQILAGGKGSRLASPAGPRRADRPGRRAVHARLHRWRLDLRGLGDRPAGRGPVDRVEAAFHEELERLAVEPVTDDELARALALVEADELGALQRVEERADRLSMYATLFDDPGLINRMLPRYLSVTPEDIREVAAAVFRPDNRLVLTYLPEAAPRTTSATPSRGRDRPTQEVAA